MEQTVRVLEVSPEDFKRYQDQIASLGCSKITFRQCFFDMIKMETNLAVLIKRRTKVAWIPKSCLYKLEEASDSEIGSVWVMLSFNLDWREDC